MTLFYLTLNGEVLHSEVIPDLNFKSRDSGIPTKINPGIPENRENFPENRESGISRDFPGIGIPEN